MLDPRRDGPYRNPAQLGGGSPRQRRARPVDPDRVARRPASCTALGKVLLAGMDAETREQFVRDAVSSSQLEPRTQNTIADPHKFSEHLSSVALQGSAVDIEEYEVGLRCAAAPVCDESGRVVAALSASGPS
ncbi:MAG: IclR family transcriptional regulator C-terminal domain-containing protein, partial [Deltaproteobacteria bacterium]|nr:IclR family transcriptional regulator C-terminal domain-containing protein [Deltaproteobacteria bacterium]